MESLTTSPVVLDNGTSDIKAGYAGEEQPTVIVPNLVGRCPYPKAMAGAVDGCQGGLFVGAQAEKHRGILRLSHPMSHGEVTDWHDMERVWNEVFSSLQVRPEDHAFLLTEAPHNSHEGRRKTAEVFFETFGVPAVFFPLQAVLALYASGVTTGVVLDVGEGVSHSVPVYEGFAVTNAATRIDLGGRDVTDFLRVLLRKTGHRFYTSADMEIVKDIKEKECHITHNVAQYDEYASKGQVDTGQYRMPDGTILALGAETFKAPELLFNPSLAGLEFPGVHQVLIETITKCQVDLRRRLYSSVYLAGGSTLFRGFGDRLCTQMRKEVTPKDLPMKVYAPPERKYSVWIGGGILASLASFKSLWITKAEFEEDPRILQKKTFC
eukprot:NODE_1809_length_1292_cov_20.427192_g1498_i0.p1 GENE.NODE_1809_length_1292_cov_20.427192_g1498_i0~~NODE_1809_length_1292_cov_20.427192_g1498_i0.p1  ORF type:complete len:380 (+),score=55.55 NODE_1809_length_1292_cov_20.427192_g1498_i0:120-1259(+)